MRFLWSVFKFLFPLFLIVAGCGLGVLNPIFYVLIAYGVYLYYGMKVKKKSFLTFAHTVCTPEGDKTTWGIIETKINKNNISKGFGAEIINYFIPIYIKRYSLIENIGYVFNDGICNFEIKKNLQDFGFFDVTGISDAEAKAAMQNPASLDLRIIQSYEENRSHCKAWASKFENAGVFHDFSEYDSMIIAKTPVGQSVFFPYCNSTGGITGIVINSNKITDESVAERFLYSISTNQNIAGRVDYDEKRLAMAEEIFIKSRDMDENGSFELFSEVRIFEDVREQFLSDVVMNSSPLSADYVKNLLIIHYGTHNTGLMAVIIVLMVAVTITMGCIMVFSLLVQLLIDAVVIFLMYRSYKKKETFAEAIRNSELKVEAYMCDGKHVVKDSETADQYYIKVAGKDIEVPSSRYSEIKLGIPLYFISSLAGGGVEYFCASRWLPDETLRSKIEVKY